MTTLITDAGLAARLIAERQAAGTDRFDEVWDGIYVMNPLPNLEHQDLVMALGAIFKQVTDAGLGGKVYPGINVSDRLVGWEHEFRVPDVAVYLSGNPAQTAVTHCVGGPDLAVEIVSPGDRTREKIAFYGRVGTRELLIVDRDPWLLELWRLGDGNALKLAGNCVPDDSQPLHADSLALEFRLTNATPAESKERRPRIEVRHSQTGQSWLV